MDQEIENLTSEPEPPQADEKYALHPTEGRFLFVEIAAQRAKQLRRGARNRLRPVDPDVPGAEEPATHRKPERVAMEEVRRGFVQFGVGDEQPLHTKAEGLA